MSVNQVKVKQAAALVKDVIRTEPDIAKGHLRLAVTALTHLEASLRLIK